MRSLSNHKHLLRAVSNDGFPFSLSSDFLTNMTLSAYLGLLSLGSTIQTRYNAECQQEEQQELDALRAMAQHISAAEIDTVSAVSIHHAPSERRGTFKKISAGSFAFN